LLREFARGHQEYLETKIWCARQLVIKGFGTAIAPVEYVKGIVVAVAALGSEP
jgi:hypothetical protein